MPPGTNSTFVWANDYWNEFDWRLTLDYHLNEDLMAYGITLQHNF